MNIMLTSGMFMSNARTSSIFTNSSVDRADIRDIRRRPSAHWSFVIGHLSLVIGEEEKIHLTDGK
jgi:hypothetical protein